MTYVFLGGGVEGEEAQIGPCTKRVRIQLVVVVGMRRAEGEAGSFSRVELCVKNRDGTLLCLQFCNV